MAENRGLGPGRDRHLNNLERWLAFCSRINNVSKYRLL